MCLNWHWHIYGLGIGHLLEARCESRFRVKLKLALLWHKVVLWNLEANGRFRLRRCEARGISYKRRTGGGRWCWLLFDCRGLDRSHLAALHWESFEGWELRIVVIIIHALFCFLGQPGALLLFQETCKWILLLYWRWTGGPRGVWFSWLDLFSLSLHWLFKLFLIMRGIFSEVIPSFYTVRNKLNQLKCKNQTK